ncbi:MAG: lysophospholipase [Thermoflexales bacterium]
MTQTTTRTLMARDGAALFLREWTPAGASRAALLICHGLGEHSGRYAHVAERLADIGITVWVHDHRGHGQSSGARGALASSDDLVVDAEQALAELARATALVPFIAGHSMGGPVAGMVALRDKVAVRGLILSSPALKTRAAGGLVVIGKMMAYLAPNMAMANQLLVEYVARDLAVVDAYRKDPLVHPTITPRLFAWIVNSGKVLRDAAPVWKTPTLVLFAGADKLVDPAGARAFVAGLPSGIGVAHEYPAFYHEIFNDPEKDSPLGDMEAWLTPRM